MNHRTRHVIHRVVGIALAILIGAPYARAMVCTTLPVCAAKPGDRVCSSAPTRACNVDADCSPGTCVSAALGVSGTVSGNGNNVSSLVLQNPGTDNLTLTSSGVGTASVSFRVVPTNAAANAQDVVVATTSAGPCTVPVSFLIRAVGAPSSEPVCPLLENYSLTVVSAPSSPAGTTACSSHLATCADVPPPGFDFPSGSRFLTVRSPIAGSSVVMDLTQSGAFDNRLRFLFARSVDQGATFSSFTDNTTSVTSGSTIIRGTGQWSDIKVIAGVPVGVPTLGQWAAIIMGLLLMTASSLLATRLRPTLAAEGPRDHAAAPPFFARRFAGALLGTAVVAVVAVASLAVLGWRPTAADLIGASISATIVAYLAHLWAAPALDRSNDRD